MSRDNDDRKADSVVRARLRDVAVGGALALGLVVLGIVWMVAGERTSASASTMSGEVQAIASTTDTAVVVEISPLSSPEVLLAAPDTDPAKPSPRRWMPGRSSLAPTAPSPAPRAAPVPSPPLSTPSAEPPPAAPPVSTPPSPAPAPLCQPPYVVDAVSGKKQWKLECL
jgi:hypothetical protein